MNRILDFYGTVGNSNETTLTIDRTGMLDLSYLFKWFFSGMGDGYTDYWDSERWDVNEKTAVARFDLKGEFFRNFLGRYEPNELADFLEEHIKNKEDFHNETLVEKLRNFDNNHERIHYYDFSKRHFLLEPMTSDKNYMVKKVEEIESIFAPNFHKKISREDSWYFGKMDRRIKEEYSLEDDERGITKPYRKDSFSKVFEKLNKELDKPLFPVNVYFGGPNLDYFSIIRTCEDIPTDHLKLVEK